MCSEPSTSGKGRTPEKPSRWREFFRLKLRPWGVFTATGALAGVCTVVGFLGCLWWPLDLASHFRAQYFIVLAVHAVILAIGRKRIPALLVGALALPNLAVILPLYFGGRSTAGRGDPSARRVMLLNIHSQHGDPVRVTRAIGKYDPDVLVLEEVTPEWPERLSHLESTHPHRILEVRDDNFGIGLFSKMPLREPEIVYVGSAVVPSIVSAVVFPEGALHIFATHPPPPGGPETTAWRDDQLRRIPRFLSDYPPPLLLVGDLNITPWSCHFGRLLRKAGLHDSERGWGYQPTWPAGNPIFWIPIDHCLYSDGIEILGREVGPNVGSDHYPVIVDFILTGS